MINIEQNSIKKFEELFKKRGYKFTEQRKIICSIMIENSRRHLNAREICDMAKRKGHTIGTATIYRTLLIMDELRITTSFSKKNGTNKYELYELNTDGEMYKHIHLICMNCEKIIDINEKLFIESLMVRIQEKYNFKIEDMQIEFYGICKECGQKDAL
ncbi:Fur family transcriptional regulator [Clostridium sp. JNZ X4-2]